MTASYYDEMRGRLLGLLIQFGDRLHPKAAEWTQEFLDHNELGLALETMAEALADAAAAITDDELSEMLNLVSKLGIDEQVSHSIARCQSST